MPQESEATRERLRRIQTALGVDADGLLGPETLTALERRFRITVKKSAASLECSRASVALIVAFEVGSPQTYELRYRRPVWPGGESGVTIGIGYDLGYASKSEIDADWGPHLEADERKALIAAQGVRGAGAKRLARNLSAVIIPFAAAEQVFYVTTLPRFARLTRATFPRAEALPPDAQGALLSLVYNRGTSLAGERRREMRAIRDLVDTPAPDLDLIANQFEAMQRLWPELEGLRKRRLEEAALVRDARRNLPAGDKVRV
jgi:hypothetical protein